MNRGKTLRIVIVIIGAVLLIAAIIFAIIKGNADPKTPDATIPSNTITVSDTTTQTGYDVAGVWYSDQDNSDVLVLNQDGTYTSSWWLASGKYIIDGNNLSLTDSFDTTKTLIIKTVGAEHVLFFDNEPYSHSYFRTQEEVELSRQEQAEQDEEMQLMYESALMQILTTDDWIGLDGCSTLTFTNTEYTVVYVNPLPYGERELVNTQRYRIDSFVVEKNLYTIKWTLIGNSYDANGEMTGDKLTILVEDNTYKMHCAGLPFERNFSKTVDIVFTQPQEPVSDDSSSQESEAPQSTSTTVVNINENPDFSEHHEELISYVEREIIGTWKGTYHHEPIASNTVYWIYTFTADGKYIFENGDTKESGTYTLSHHPGTEKYHSTISFLSNDGTERASQFYISTGNKIMLTFEGDSNPSYFKN